MSQVTLIEFDENGRPFSVNRTGDDGYDHKFDMEWCKRDGCLYADESGDGYYLENGEHKYWTIPGIEPTVNGICPAPLENRLTDLPESYQGDLWDWANEGGCEYCSICDDMLPTEDLCNHIGGDDESGWSTP